jgi:hypothetical protein
MQEIEELKLANNEMSKYMNDEIRCLKDKLSLTEKNLTYYSTFSKENELSLSSAKLAIQNFENKNSQAELTISILQQDLTAINELNAEKIKELSIEVTDKQNKIKLLENSVTTLKNQVINIF